MKFKDYYEILGVDHDASADQIKKAYRKLARKFHPDVSKEPQAEARMKELNEAFAVLSEPEKRQAYDRVGQGMHAGQEFHAPPGWDAGADTGFGRHPFGAGGAAGSAEFSDFFSELFGRMRSGEGPGAGTRAHHPGGRSGFGFASRGEDQRAVVELDLKDAYQGTTRSIGLRAPEVDAHGRTRYRERTLEVTIPRGVQEGQLIRLGGQGSAGAGGGPAGDLYLEVRFKPHPRYRVDGRDVTVTLPVTPWEAMLGATVEALVPDGSVEVRVPPHSQNGRKLRLKGRGIPGGTQGAGDLYLLLDVVLPPAESAKAKQFYQQMAHELPFNPRQNLRH